MSQWISNSLQKISIYVVPTFHTMALFFSFFLALLSVAVAFHKNIQRQVFKSNHISNRHSTDGSSTALFYTFFPFKKTDDEKKEVGRLLKNVLFPGLVI